jgi:hypothetical protein
MISNFKVQVHEIDTCMKMEGLLFVLHVRIITTNGF